MQLFGGGAMASAAQGYFGGQLAELSVPPPYPPPQDCNPVNPSPMSTAKQALWDTINAKERRRDMRRMAASQMDQDILSLRSVSPVNKVRMQVERETATQSIIARLRDAAYEMV